MKLSKLHKTIIIISILLLLIGMFTSDKVIKPSYREQKTETDQEIDLLSIRQDLIENKLYYEKDIENNPTDVENYNSRDTIHPLNHLIQLISMRYGIECMF